MLKGRARRTRRSDQEKSGGKAHGRADLSRLGSFGRGHAGWRRVIGTRPRRAEGSQQAGRTQIASGHFDEQSQHDTGIFSETAGDLRIDARNTAGNRVKSGLLVSRACAAIAIHKRAAAAVTPAGPAATVRQFRDDRCSASHGLFGKGLPVDLAVIARRVLHGLSFRLRQKPRDAVRIRGFAPILSPDQPGSDGAPQGASLKGICDASRRPVRCLFAATAVSLREPAPFPGPLHIGADAGQCERLDAGGIPAPAPALAGHVLCATQARHGLTTTCGSVRETIFCRASKAAVRSRRTLQAPIPPRRQRAPVYPRRDGRIVGMGFGGGENRR